MCGEVGRDFFYDDSTKERFSFLLPMKLQNMRAKGVRLWVGILHNNTVIKQQGEGGQRALLTSTRQQ